MRIGGSFLGILALCGLLTVGQTECPPGMQLPSPPFSMAGTYAGTWSGTPSNQVDLVSGCGLTLTIEHDVNLDFPGNLLARGTATIDYSCIALPEWIPEPEATTVPLLGGIDKDGNISLGTGGCTTALCVVLTLTGQGADLDGDGAMDVFGGIWNYQVLLAGVEPFGVTGTFEAMVQ